MVEYKSIRIGPELLARMEAVAARYGATVNTIARKAALSLARGRFPSVEENESAKGSTQRDAGTVLKVETDASPETLRRAIDLYLTDYEGDDAPEPPKPLPGRVRYQIEQYARNCGKTERMIKQAQLDALKMELGQ